jgi:primosomal protein N' (replication factor Y) (superfamily II helicase)
MAERITLFADILLPLALRGYFTYRVPYEWNELVMTGTRVVVPFSKNKFYTGLIRKLHQNPPKDFEAKYLESLVDDRTLVTENQFKLWEWMADYYMCTPGEVMIAALPAGLRLSSETFFFLNTDKVIIEDELTDKEFLIVEALQLKQRLSLEEVSEITGLKNPQSFIRKMIVSGLVLAGEEIEQRVKPKLMEFVTLSKKYESDRELKELLDSLESNPKQEKKLNLLLTYLKLSNHFSSIKDSVVEVKKKDLLKESSLNPSVFKTLEKKGVFVVDKREVSRLPQFSDNQYPAAPLNDFQLMARKEIDLSFKEEKPVLLHGITSSGKTEVYTSIIEEVIGNGQQVLFLVPEIALTTQLIYRLKKVFGNKIGIYHSKFSENERVEIWNHLISDDGQALYKKQNNELKVILGARSALLLPFSNLGLIIVDEEHDPSFKQHDPAPRYNARDTAIVLAKMYNARCILGSATPSVESYINALEGKFKLVEMKQRYGGASLPLIEIADMRMEKGHKGERKVFSRPLIKAIEESLQKNEQVILFQNRRGFSPMQICEDCHWIPKCKNCDVSLSYHKGIHQLRCHYCGYSVAPYKQCASCSSFDLRLLGVGTEKIEEDLGLIFPNARIARMDLDSTRSKFSYKKIIDDFENREIDILVGTQMITKGLDFNHVNLVGIINADALIGFPDFRAHERAFQLMSQVSGRAGRRGKEGRVIIQTSQPLHPLVLQVIQHDFFNFMEAQISERRRYYYPPFCRLIKITIKDKNRSMLENAAWFLAGKLREKLNEKVLGPETPSIERINNYYLREILIKIPKNVTWTEIRAWIFDCVNEAKKQEGIKQTRYVIDVDPN